VSPKVGLLFRTTEWLTIWGSYAEAFLAPGLTEQSAEGLHFRGIPGVFPDKAGLRTRFDDLLIEGDRLRLEAAYFDIDVEDFIDLEVVHLRGDDPPNNPQKAELRGFETELGYDASRFFAAMSYSETRARMQGEHSRPSPRTSSWRRSACEYPSLASSSPGAAVSSNAGTRCRRAFP
jgi:hemoglobin/transferrin/lactoferrin receptor protein